jgi:hypothetical protein
MLKYNYYRRMRSCNLFCHQVAIVSMKKNSAESETINIYLISVEHLWQGTLCGNILYSFSQVVANTQIDSNDVAKLIFVLSMWRQLQRGEIS